MANKDLGIWQCRRCHHPFRVVEQTIPSMDEETEWINCPHCWAVHSSRTIRGVLDVQPLTEEEERAWLKELGQ